MYIKRETYLTYVYKCHIILMEAILWKEKLKEWNHKNN